MCSDSRMDTPEFPRKFEVLIPRKTYPAGPNTNRHLISVFVGYFFAPDILFLFWKQNNFVKKVSVIFLRGPADVGTKINWLMWGHYPRR